MNLAKPYVVVAISANAEWRVVRAYYSDREIQKSPFGEWFEIELGGRPVIFLHGGWAKSRLHPQRSMPWTTGNQDP